MQMNDLIYRDTARRIISSPRSQEQMLRVLDTALPVDAIPTSKIRDAIAEIIKEFNNNTDNWNYQSGLFKAKDIIKEHTGVSECSH